ncbi:unnamed protein product [Brachionus calyciflorus]|uniref:Molybdopterin synthase sulfur carrier subunit n=1 Tax=Brachionus calyciflorus TaxID=104777 RepID=A0A813QBC0_9BILA|nr:unnamed protein product [Brachionus calyciflorus]
MDSISIKVLFFGKARDLVGVGQKDVDILHSNLKANEFLEIIISKFPRLEEIKSSTKLSLNEEYVEMNDVLSLKSGDEIAVIPPISGG